MAEMSRLREGLRSLALGARAPGHNLDRDLRYRTVSLGVLFATASLIAYALMYWMRGERYVALIHLLGLLPTCIAWYLNARAGKLEAAMHLLASGLFVVIAVSIHSEGGLTSSSTPWLALLPAMFVLAGMPRGAALWLVAGGAYLLTLLYLTVTGYAFPQPRDPLALATRVTDNFLLGATFCAFIVLLERGRRQAMHELAARNAELALANEAVLAAARSKARFLANMSHEIRTPMNGVLGNIEQLATTALDPRQQELVCLLRQSGDTMLALIDDVLDFSRLEADRMPLEKAAFDLRESLGQVASQFRGQAVAKGLSFALEIAREVPASVLGDAERVRQVLANLVNNAVKFTARGSVRIEVWLQEGADEHVHVGIGVSDTGIGIAPEHAQRLFEPFTHGDESNTPTYAGVGLGLAICSALVRRMGGRLEMSSMPGVGSRFSCVLVLGRDRSPRSAAGRQLTTAAQCAPLGVRPRVLLAEDNPVNQLVARGMLAKLGCDTDVALNGALAVEAMTRTRFDVILMDCQMPVMDGLEATRAIRENESRAGQARTPIVALTANAQPGDREHCLAAGMDDHLGKPVTLERLRTALARVLAADRILQT